MAERRENSVLFSLRELRTIEEDRVKGEEEAERARIDAEKRAREEEIRRAREAEEAKVRAEQDRIRREQDERERADREGQLRLQEAERRAQIEAAARLEQTRIEAEARARMEGKKFPIGAVVGGIIGLIVVAGGVMGYLVHSHNVELAQQQAELQAKAEADAKRIKAESDAAIAAQKKELADLQAQFEKATDENEKQKIRQRMEAASRPHVASRPSKSTADDAPKTPAKPKIKTDTSDPLGGLPGL